MHFSRYIFKERVEKKNLVYYNKTIIGGFCYERKKKIRE